MGAISGSLRRGSVGGGSRGCETEQSSRYTTVLGVPVSVLALVGYSGLLASAVLRGEVGVYLGFLIALMSLAAWRLTASVEEETSGLGGYGADASHDGG